MAADYRLSARADRDLTEIYIYTFEKFGEAQADRYLLELHDCLQRLAGEPGSGRALREVTGTTGASIAEATASSISTCPMASSSFASSTSRWIFLATSQTNRQIVRIGAGTGQA
ncbi:MAG TPA: type II toxin-antitoxin system RelE/ParE family toxin [Rhizomicrobium sp.]|nr:type II toxin-antitoxin system RelE/ParE family toxin [Rhizomicrobium sp.]